MICINHLDPEIGEAKCSKPRRFVAVTFKIVSVERTETETHVTFGQNSKITFAHVLPDWWRPGAEIRMWQSSGDRFIFELVESGYLFFGPKPTSFLN